MCSKRTFTTTSDGNFIYKLLSIKYKWFAADDKGREQSSITLHKWISQSVTSDFLYVGFATCLQENRKGTLRSCMVCHHQSTACTGLRAFTEKNITELRCRDRGNSIRKLPGSIPVELPASLRSSYVYQSLHADVPPFLIYLTTPSQQVRLSSVE